ncbi:MAG: hypothetical protein Q9200_001982 [Gallowayella weberi]
MSTIQLDKSFIKGKAKEQLSDEQQPSRDEHVSETQQQQWRARTKLIGRRKRSSKENRDKERPKDGRKPENQNVSGEQEVSGKQPRKSEAQRKNGESFKHRQDAGWIPHLLAVRGEKSFKAVEPILFQYRQWQDNGRYWATTHAAEDPRCMTPKELQNRKSELCSLVKLHNAMSMLEQVLGDAAILGGILHGETL